ncbi:MAG: hypothetical protein JNM17_06620 [Archangium sp.]|nr:hypothetical protein [Archangium sp.]
MENRSRGIDTIAMILVAVLLLEAVAAVMAQMHIWGGNHWVATRVDFVKPWMPSTLAVAGALFALEAVVRKRPEQAVFTRVVVALVIAVALALATVLGFAAGQVFITRPVG